jgi:quercetin dioxygenase-like cupin family protein
MALTPRWTDFHVLEGVALVQSRGGPLVEVAAGETAVCPPDEEHWHGASPTSFMTHHAVWDTLPGRPSAVWGDHVTGTEYQAPFA